MKSNENSRDCRKIRDEKTERESYSYNVTSQWHATQHYPALPSTTQGEEILQ